MLKRLKSSPEDSPASPIIASSSSRSKKIYSFSIGRTKSQSFTVIRGMPDYVDIAVSQSEHLEKKKKIKKWSDVCHPIVIMGLVTTVVYALFISLLLAYMNIKEFRDFVHSLKRLENIKEWFRIIFKPWQSDKVARHHDDTGRQYNHHTQPPIQESDLDPEADVKILE